MVLNRYFITTIIGIAFLALTLPFAFASNPEPGPSTRPVPLFNLLPRLRNQMILETIHFHNPKLDSFQRNRICIAIITEASRYNFDPFFISSVIAAESSFSTRAVSRCAARGLMQLTDPVIRIMGIRDPFDIQENINGGIRYLNDLRKIFPRQDLILAAYNAGPTRVGRLQRIPDISETIHYVAKVTALYSSFQKQFHYLFQHTIVNSIYFSIASRVILPDQPNVYLNKVPPPLPAPFFDGPLAHLYEPRKKLFFARRSARLTEKTLRINLRGSLFSPFIG
ncbi:MAG: lytic transglycosylase domain-containing protein [Firmicutes bacterium]|nr:lytic transglycosylase domain-containing protein [Bacillota bacterium]